MKLNMKCGIRGCRLCHENGTILGRITRDLFHGCILHIEDASGQQIGELHRTDSGIQWNTSDIESSQAMFQYRLGKNGRPLQLSWIRPPMPVSLTLDTQWGKLYVTQSEKREYQIFLNQNLIGNIRHMLHKNKEILTEDETLAFPEIYCLSYGMAWFLLQDDQIET